MYWIKIFLRDDFCKNRASRRTVFGRPFLKLMKFFLQVGNVELWKKFSYRNPRGYGNDEICAFEFFEGRHWLKFFNVWFHISCYTWFDAESRDEFNELSYMYITDTGREIYAKNFLKCHFFRFFNFKKIKEYRIHFFRIFWKLKTLAIQRCQNHKK